MDPYDDTMFNEGQLRVIATELDELIRDCPGDIAAAAHEIMDLMQFVKSSQHGQMVFSGD
ncbi:hypothetical protein [Actinokineospora sp.]|uniref:hypothetical protein n=1 Tax=Actinokineospora sp. TaxID=1872133 RepID=UPI0040382505